MKNLHKQYAKALTNTIIIKSNINDFILEILNKNKDIYIARKRILKEDSWGENRKSFNYKQINIDVKKSLNGAKIFSSINYHSINEKGNAMIFFLTNNKLEKDIITNNKTIINLKQKEKETLAKLLINYLLLEEGFGDKDSSIISDNIYFKISPAYRLKGNGEIHQNLLETNINTFCNKEDEIIIFVELITKKIKLDSLTLKEAKSADTKIDNLLLDKHPIFLHNKKGAETFFEVDMEKAINSRLYIYQYINQSISNQLSNYNINYINSLFEADNRYKISIDKIDTPVIDLIIINNTENDFSNTDKFILSEVLFKNENIIFFNHGYSSTNIDAAQLLNKSDIKKYFFISDHNGFFKEKGIIKTINDNNFKLNTTYIDINKKLHKNNDTKTDLYSKFKYLNKDKLMVISQNIILLDKNNKQLSLIDFFDINSTNNHLKKFPKLKEDFLKNYVNSKNKIEISQEEKKLLIHNILTTRNTAGIDLLKYNSKINKTISELNLKDNILSNNLISVKTNISKLYLIKKLKDIYHCLILDIIDNKLSINKYFQCGTITELNASIDTLNGFHYDFTLISITDKDFTIVDDNYSIIQSIDTKQIIIGNPIATYFTNNLKYAKNRMTNEPTNNLDKSNSYNFLPYYTNPLNIENVNIKEQRAYIYTKTINKKTINYVSTIKESINNLSNANKIYELKILSNIQNNTEELIELFFNTFTSNIIKINDFSKTTILEKYINIFIYN